MALTVGELTAAIGVDDSKMDSGLDASESKFRAFGSKLSAAAVALGAAAGAALVGGIAESMNVEAANDKLSAQLGLTAEESRRIGGVAGELYAGAYGSSLEDVNVALRGVIQNVSGMRGATEDELSAIGAKVLDVGTAFEQDFGEVSRAVGKMLKTGLASDADEALDILTRGFQTGADEADDLLDTINEYSTQFRKFGLDGAVATGLLTQGLQAGARDADVVADAIKEFAIRAIDGSASTAEGFQAIGLSADTMAAKIAAGGPQASAALDLVLDRLRSMEDPVARDAAAVALFGGKAEDLGAALYALDPSTAVGALGQVEGAAARMGDTLNDNAQTNLTAFWRQAKTAFVDIVGGRVLPVINTAASFLATMLGPALSAVGTVLDTTVIPAVQAFGQWVQQNQTPLTIIGGLIASVFIPHLVALGVASTVNAAKAVASWLAMKASAVGSAVAHSATVAAMVAKWVLLGVQSTIQAARVAAAWVVAMGPVAWVIAAVVGLVALIIANWETVKAWTVKIWNAVWKWVSDRVSDIANWVRARVQDVLTFFGWLASLPGKVAGWFGAAKNWAVRKLGELVRWVASLPGRIIGAIGDIAGRMVQVGKDIISGIVRGLSAAASWIWDKLKSIVASAWDSVLDFFGIASPSKEGMWAGEMIGLGLARGIDSMSDMVGLAAARLAEAGRIPAAEAELPHAPALPRPRAGSTTGASGTLTADELVDERAGSRRAVIKITNYHPPASASAWEVAEELDWFSRTGG